MQGGVNIFSTRCEVVNPTTCTINKANEMGSSDYICKK